MSCLARLLLGQLRLRYWAGCPVSGGGFITMERLFAGVLAPMRFPLQVAIDAVAWFAALYLAALLRYEFKFEEVNFAGVLLVGVLAAVAQMVIGSLIGLYIHRWRYGTFGEIAGLARTLVPVGGVVVLANRFLLGHRLPVSATAIALGLAAIAMAAARFGWRLLLDRYHHTAGAEAEPVIIYGAGSGGEQVIRSMMQPGSPYRPVALIDDDRDLRNLRIRNVRVWGGRERLAAVVERFGVKSVVLAMPGAPGDLVRELVEICDDLELATLVLPPVSSLFGAAVGVKDIRPLTEADYLGRRELNTDIDAVANYLTGRRVLVTGAGGSIGSELCRQLQRFAPESVVMLDRDESALQAVQVSIEGRGLLDSRELVVASIRDLDRLREVFDEHRPEVVFHAAALKHLSLLEMHPEEGFKTNVLGTQNMLEVAQDFGVTTFVNISTDKAADPSSVLGRTKRLAERLTSNAARTSQGAFMSVRFGNVLGSRGSVLPLFRAQIERGGPITVTHPEVTRFFMTIEEACQLVIQAGAVGGDGDVMVLDMGESVRIDDLAKRLIKEADRPIEIVYTGLRPGEKLDEVLFGPDETAVASAHPLISSVSVPPITPAQVFHSQEPANSQLVVDLRGTSQDGAYSGATGTQDV